MRKETQSTTIQIMKYVLLGCKAKRQATEHQLGVVCCGTALPAVPPVLLQGHTFPCQYSSEQESPSRQGCCRKGPTSAWDTGLWGRVKDGGVTHKQPDGMFHLLQHLAGIGGDRADP